MKSATQCLKAPEIQALLSGTAFHVESKKWEDHVSACEHCRAALAGSIGDEDWWHEAEQSLMGLPKPESQESIDNEGETIDELLKLLGPTDDPRMLGRIGFYEVLGLLGRGGMGVVFKAFDASLNRFVAIKMLLPHLAASGAARKRFAREAQAIAAVVDDHVMAIHCVDEWQGVPYFVMTYSRGVSLQKRLGDYGPLEVREILRIGMQAAKGLAAAHAQGIVHRDIKPANIFLDHNVQRVQLMDFGLARAVDDASLTRSGTLAGTPQYMSPEQARSEAIDHRSDLFSLGSVLYAMCTGHSPFRSESSYSVLRLIIEKEPRPIREINSDIPEWLCAIIGKLMSKSPEDRYGSAMDLARILEQCLAHVQDPVQHSLPVGQEESNRQAKSKGNVESELNRWFLVMKYKRVVSLISLILLLMALLVPWPIAAIGSLKLALPFTGVVSDSDASPASLNGNSDKVQAEVRGTVTDSQGIAIPRAELRSSQSLKSPPLATTDELGRYSFRVPKSQKLHLLTIGPMCSPALQKLVVDRDLELNIQLQQSRGLNLKLVDAKGTPIPGVKVSGDDWRDFAIIHQMTTDDEGRVKWSEAPNDSMEYLITKDGFSPWYNIKLRADSAEQTVVLTRVVEIQVQAQDDETNQPVHDFVAVPVLKSGADVDPTCDRRSAIHTLNGTAQMKLHESQSQTCLIRIEAKGYAVANCPVFEIENAPASVVVKLKCVDSLRGSIIDPSGNPALGSMVSFANPNQPFTLRKPNQNYSVAANEKGEFASSYEEGDYTIVAQSDIGFAMKHCKAGNQPGTIQLESWAKIEGQISQGTSGITSHLVSLSDLTLEKPGQPCIDLEQSVHSDQQGNFSIEHVPPSRYALHALHSIFKSDELKSTESLPVDVKAGGRMTCKLGVTGASVRGNVQVSNEASRGRIAYRWSLNYLVSIEDPERGQSPEKLSSAEESTFPSFNSAATWSTTEGMTYLRSFRHWQFELDDDGSYLIHGVPPGKYRMYVNLFDPPEDGCLAAPLAIKALDVFVPQHQESIALSNIELEASNLLKVGDVVPNFEYLQLDGTKARLNDLRGQVVLIQLWASWCEPCIAEFPDIREFVKSATGQRCVVLGLSVDDPDQENVGLLEKHKVDWPQGTLPSGLDSPVLRQLSVSSIPTHFVIGTDGRLVFAGRDFEKAKKAIASSLASEAKP